MKLMLKGCPRCGGDLMPDRWDLSGEDMCCAQCGYTASVYVLRQARNTLQPVGAVSSSYEAALQRKVA